MTQSALTVRCNMRYKGDMLAYPSDAITLLGGKHAVSARTKRKLTTVASWGDRDSIPVEAWPQLIEFAQELRLKGFTYEAIAKAHVRAVQKPRPRKAA